MVWKQDLAKLKQQLAPEAEPPVPKPPPRTQPKPTSGPIEEEDAVFLAAMGLKPSAPKKHPAIAESKPVAPAKVDAPPPETFLEALQDLKGLKPLPKNLSEHASAPPPRRAPTGAPEKRLSPALPLPPQKTLERLEVTPPPPVAEPHPIALTGQAPTQTLTPMHASMAPAPGPPIQFQLAAGMALEVDATLDLRGHSLVDAMERLKDRLGDAQLLGWRILQVILGSDPILHEGFLAVLAAGQAPLVARYAQAPIPMGGNQAWLLYLGAPVTTP
jgi:DNA-nicking Smr family endonuclease